MYKLTIPKPCHQNWDEMLPNEQGRHCLSCAKTVVDFSNMTDYEVQHFFINKQNESVCGRFKTTQLNTIEIQLPQNIFTLAMPLWKQVLAACLLAFGMMLFSCNANVQGKIEKGNNIEMLGAIDMLPDSTELKKDTISLPKPPKNIEEMQGEVQMVESYTVGDVAPPAVLQTVVEDTNILIGKPEPLIIEPKIDSAIIKDTVVCEKKVFL